MKNKKELTSDEIKELLSVLKVRFVKHMNRHETLDWEKVLEKLHAKSEKLWSLNEMEKTGGEPDVIDFDKERNEYFFYDCSPESPSGRRSLCYDKKAQDARKKFKPESNAKDMAADIGIDLLTEEQYRKLQRYGEFDTKTSSWIETPEKIRALGGALFGDFRYKTVFIYHNGADSYYAARGFRGSLRV